MNTSCDYMTGLSPAFLLSVGDHFYVDSAEVVLTGKQESGNITVLYFRDVNGTAVRDMRVKATKDFKVLLGV